MKLKKLKFAAFGPYDLEQTIDFERFKKDEVFLITGDTGSGKTTIFDAISFALFGDVSGQRKEVRTLKSDFSDSKRLCFVEFQFEINGEKYLIKRCPEQLVLKKNGDGLKQQKHKAELVLPDGKIETNLKEISNILVNEVLCVDKENFNKLIMLPQGQFQRLLTEKGEEQVATFRKLFGTKIFEDIANSLFEEKQKIKKEYDIKISENLNNIRSNFSQDGDFEFDENLSFSKMQQIFSQQNEKEKQKLKELEKSIEEKNEQLKNIEVCLKLEQAFEKKKDEIKKLKIKKQELELKNLDEKKLNKEKETLILLENCKIYFNFWQEKEKQFEKKKIEINNLQKKLKEQKIRKENATLNFKQIGFLEEEKEKIEKKKSSFLIMQNSFNLAKEVEVKINGVKKEIFLVEKNKEKLNKKIAVLNFKLEVEKEKEKEFLLKEFVKLKENENFLQDDLTKLNARYLNLCKDFYEHQAFRLAKNLKKGCACPVCGSLSHPNPKKTASFKLVGEKTLEDCRKKIFDEKDRLNLLIVRKNEIYEKLKEKEIDCSKYENVLELKQLLKNLQINLYEKAKILQLELKKEKDCLKLNSDENLKEKINEFDVELFKLKSSLKELSLQHCRILETIPENLREKQNLLQYEKEILKKEEEVKRRITTIKENMDKEEAEFDRLNSTFCGLEKVLKETENEFFVSKKKFYDALSKTGKNLEEFLENLSKLKILSGLIKESEKNLKELEAVNFRIGALKEDLKNFKQKGIDNLLKESEVLVIQLEKEREQEKILIKKIAIKSNSLKEIEKNLKEIEKLEENFKLAKILSEVAKGAKNRVSFEKYVLTAYLNEVLFFANDWFKKVTFNRYFFSNLNMEDCLNFNVFDCYSGKIRHVSTLSGGETFAASLALCLGLCSHVSKISGGIEMGTMLIDEGFGNLDGGYLDSLTSCLINLNKHGRQIGVISHIKELKSRIKNQIVVKKNLQGGSMISLKF